MADVAFLVVIFFWVATSIPAEKRIVTTLPNLPKELICRGYSYIAYIQALDQIKAAYTSVRAKELGWSEEKSVAFSLKTKKMQQKKKKK